MADVPVSVIIPTFNMAGHLDGLWSELHASGLIGRAREIIVVDDGSTDNTADIVNAFIAGLNDPVTRFRAVRLPANGGRFRARFEGARAATSEFLLFLDTRLKLPAAFADRLFAYLPGDRCLQGLTRLDTDQSVFDLYWDRTHTWMFRRHYQDAEHGLVITADNYDRYLKGTTVFACPADVFLRACRSFEGADLRNDDTALLAAIVRTHPIHVRSDFEFYWFPRRTIGGFLGRIWERGPSFVEYHLVDARAAYFRLFVLALLALIGQIIVIGVVARAVMIPLWQPAAVMILLDFAGIVLTTACFARGLGEFALLAPLHLLVAIVAGATVMRSVLIALVRRAFGRERSFA